MIGNTVNSKRQINGQICGKKKRGNKVQKKRTNKVAKVRHTFIQESYAHTHIAYPSSRAHTLNTHVKVTYIHEAQTHAHTYGSSTYLSELKFKQLAEGREKRQKDDDGRDGVACESGVATSGVGMRRARRTMLRRQQTMASCGAVQRQRAPPLISTAHFQLPRVETVLLARMPARERCDVARCCLFDFPHFMVSVRLLNGKARHDHASVSLAPPIDTLRRNGTLVGLGATSASATLPGGAATSSV